MSWTIGGGGGSSLTDEQKETLSKWTYDEQSNRMSTDASVRSGLNSFELAEMHTTHSGGENVFDQNNVSGINWFPVWQGVKPLVNVGDHLGFNPTSRQYSNTFTLETNGAASTANNVSYADTITITDNESVIRLEVEAGEAYAGKLSYTIKNNDVNGITKYQQSVDVDVQIGDPITFNFTHPSESANGNTIYVDIMKDDDTGFLVKAGADTAKPWLRLVLATYEDIEVSSGVKYTTASQDVLYSTVFAVDTTNGAVTLTPDRSSGLSSFTVFDASQNFNTNACTVNFGVTQGNAVLQTKNDSFLFYWSGTDWRFLDLNTKNGGVV